MNCSAGIILSMLNIYVFQGYAAMQEHLSGQVQKLIYSISSKCIQALNPQPVCDLQPKTFADRFHDTYASGFRTLIRRLLKDSLVATNINKGS